MKIKIVASICLAAALLSVGASTAVHKIELRADSMAVEGPTTVAKGAAVAVVGEMRISAEQITADYNSGELKCLGETTISLGELTIRTRDAKIETKPTRSPFAPLPTREIRDLPTSNSKF